MSLDNLDKQIWYWGKEDKSEANRALENSYDGTFLVRESSTLPDQTLHVVYKGAVRLIKILCRDGAVGLSLDNMIFTSVVELILNFSKVSLAKQNKAVNVRLTNPLPRKSNQYTVDELIDEEETWSIYVNFFLESEILNKKSEECLQDLQRAEDEAQQASYNATAQHLVIEMWREQLSIRPMALNHFSQEYEDMIKNNFENQRRRLDDAENDLDLLGCQVTEKQTRVREFVLKKEDMEKSKRTLYRKMDWYERLLAIEGIDNETVVTCIAPFTQGLGTKILIQGIKGMWFVGLMDHIDANKLLDKRSNGTYLVRLNSNQNYILCVVNKRTTRHIRIHQQNEMYWLKPVRRFPSVEALIIYFQFTSLGHQDKDYTIKLTDPVYY